MQSENSHREKSLWRIRSTQANSSPASSGLLSFIESESVGYPGQRSSFGVIRDRVEPAAIRAVSAKPAPQDRTSEIAEALSVWCPEELSCAGARCRRRTQRGASHRNGADRLWQWRNYFSRRPEDPSARIWMWDAGSRQRRPCTLHSVHLRRQRGELTGYPFRIRLLSCGALYERHQHSCVLLLRQLNILQCRPDDEIWYRGWSRLMWRLCSDPIEIRQGEAAEVR
jgi:hypothetical protein